MSTTIMPTCPKCGHDHLAETMCIPKTIVDAAEPGLRAELAKPLSINSEHPPLLTAEEAATRIVKKYGRSLNVLAD